MEFHQGDFREEEILQQLVDLLNGQKLDLVISDIAPNMSGNTVTDQARSFYLCELAYDFAINHLKPGGHFLIKVFQGAGYQEYVKLLRESFAGWWCASPKASRDQSNEIYLLAKKIASNRCRSVLQCSFFYSLVL